MEKAYEKLLKEHKLNISDLPEDAQTGIKQINAIETALTALQRKTEKAGKTFTPSASVLKKIQTFDKWIVREILDFVEEKNTNADKPAVAATEIIAEIKDQEPTAKDEPIIKKEEEPVAVEVADAKGLKIDEELTELLKNKKEELTLEELKQFAPISYSVIFDSYEKGKENGIETTHYTLIESNEKFKITKL